MKGSVFKRVSLIILLAVMSSVASADLLDGVKDFVSSGTSTPMQQDFDIARLKDLKELGGHIERYKIISGKYPFEGVTNVSNYVHIATKGQKKYASRRPPFSHKLTDVKELVSELQKVLGEDVLIPFDPQKVPVHKPNFYVYKVHDSTYYLAVHLFQSFSFSKNVAKNYNKVEVTNSPQRGKGAWLYNDLITNEGFMAAVNEAPNKPGYVESLRRSMGGNNAF